MIAFLFELNFVFFLLFVVRVSLVAVVGNKEVDAGVCAKANVPKPAHELVKKYYNASASDSFVCRVTEVPPDTPVQIHISFVQPLHLEDERSLGFVIPTVLAPRHYFAEETAGERAPFASSLRYAIGVLFFSVTESVLFILFNLFLLVYHYYLFHFSIMLSSVQIFNFCILLFFIIYFILFYIFFILFFILFFGLICL
jgi:hypothetical protein